MKTAMQELLLKLATQTEKDSFGRRIIQLSIVDKEIVEALEKEKEQNNQIIRDVFEHCWNHPNWKGEYDIKDMNDYLKTLNK